MYSWSETYESGSGSSDVSGNFLLLDGKVRGDEKMKELIEFLKSNERIMSISICNNQLNNHQIDLFLDHLEKDDRIKWVSILQGTFDSSKISRLERILKFHNTQLVKFYCEHPLSKNIELYMQDNLNFPKK